MQRRLFYFLLLPSLSPSFSLFSVVNYHFAKTSCPVFDVYSRGGGVNESLFLIMPEANARQTHWRGGYRRKTQSSSVTGQPTESSRPHTPMHKRCSKFHDPSALIQPKTERVHCDVILVYLGDPFSSSCLSGGRGELPWQVAVAP